jgi:hypothetical protein
MAEQLRTISEVTMKNNHALTPGDFITTRHSNLEFQVGIVFHVLKGGDDVKALTEIFAICDKNGIKEISMTLPDTRHTGLTEAISGLPESGSLKMIRVQISKKLLPDLTDKMNRSLVCIHNPLTE